jgi:hypothetical protein
VAYSLLRKRSTKFRTGAPVFVCPVGRNSLFKKINETSRQYGNANDGKKGGNRRPPGPEGVLHLAWRNAGLQRASVRGRDGHTYQIVS